MFASDRIIAIDIGASKLVVAEFLAPKGSSPQLLNYGITTLDIESESIANNSAFVVSGIRDLMRKHGIKAAPMYMTISGQSVFPRYVKLPPVTRDKVLQMVQYEAEQNVPFPINEVVWDYQLITDTDDGELHVMLVAAKIENVSQYTDCVQAMGLEPEIVDVAPMALYNCVRYNYSEITGCTMILDIGARSSNLIFMEGARIFSRSIPVAGNAITQEVMKEFDLPFDEAEALKMEHGFVAFGGVYAGPDSDVADRVSKIVRNVITRLHAEVNRSINFYRSQQGGNAPQLVLLTGGSSVIPHTDTFFREKLKVDVDYMNPFVSVPVNPALDLERVSGDVQQLGEVVGLALRRGLTCPVEINLMPPDIVKKKIFRRRQPFFAASVIGVVLIMLCWWVYFYRMGTVLNQWVEIVESRTKDLGRLSSMYSEKEKDKIADLNKIDAIIEVIKKRTYWSEVINEIHSCLLNGMWIMSLRPVSDATETESDNMIIEIRGMGFEDKLKEVDRPDATALEVFRDRLRSSKYFSDKTEIKQQPLGGTFAREFLMWVYVEDDVSTTNNTEISSATK